MANKIWIDVEDLFQYAAANPRPSGIQRIEYELCRALATLPESRHRVRFVRHASSQRSFYSIPYAELDALYCGLTGDKKPKARTGMDLARILKGQVLKDQASKGQASAGKARQPPRPLSANPLRRIAYRMPTGLRTPIVAFYLAEREAGRALVHIGSALGWATQTRAKAVLRRLRPSATTQFPDVNRPSSPVPDVTTDTSPTEEITTPVAGITSFEANSEPGDVLLVLGSPWFHPYYAEVVEKAQRQRGLRFALLVYDLIPLRRPEWCDHNLVQRFREWTGEVFPLVDTFLTISRASADDIVQQADASGYRLRNAPHPIPIGTGFTSPAKSSFVAALPISPETASLETASLETAGPETASPEVTSLEATSPEMTSPETTSPETTNSETINPEPSRLPAAGSYVLIVSTIEARKNHILLFRVWRRLVEEMPRDLIPTLVFAGRIGWLVSDLMQQLRNADFLDGKILLVEDPSDEELERLYAGCRFTLFPSLYEGWGLPVTESLAFGRPCIISNATSLPEAGGKLARYFDPENAGDAYDVIRHAIETPDETEAWARQVQREFKPVTWETSARGVLHALGLPTLDITDSGNTGTMPDADLLLGEETGVHPI